MSKNKTKSIIIVVLCSILITACAKEKNNTSQIIEGVVEKLNSSEFQTRIIAINTIGGEKYRQLNYRLIGTILKENKNETKENREEKYICAKALGKSLDTKRAIKYSIVWIESRKETLQLVALYLIESAIDNNENKIDAKTKDRIGTQVTKLLNKQKNKKKVNYNIIRKTSVIIGKLKYQKAYKTLLYIAKEKQIIIKEVTDTLFILKKQNKEIEKLAPIQKIEDKRITRTIKKTRYIKTKKENYKLESRLLKNLIDLKSNAFITAYNAENYFKIFLSDKETLKNTFGKCETYDPEKIKYIIANRIDILSKTLNDQNEKIRFKTVKILANIKDKRLCEPLKRAYYQNKNKNFKENILTAIAQTNCSDNTSFIEKEDSNKQYNSPFFIHLENNPTLINEFIQKYEHLYTYQELFPSKIEYINKLINSKNEQTKINALYSLSLSKINAKNNILEQKLQKEEKPNIKTFIKEIINDN